MNLKQKMIGFRIDYLITRSWTDLAGEDCLKFINKIIVDNEIKIPRSFWQEKIKSGVIKFKQKKIKSGFRIKESEKNLINFNWKNIVRSLNQTYSASIIPYPGQLDVVYSNDNFSVINKPAPLSVHPAYPLNKKNPRDVSLIDIFIFTEKELQSRFKKGSERNGIVHRLDKKTTGLIILAKNNQYQKYFKHLFKKRLIKKKYLALVEGKPDWQEKTVESWIGKWKKDPLKRFSLPMEDRDPEREIINPKNSKTNLKLILSGKISRLRKENSSSCFDFLRKWNRTFADRFGDSDVFSLIEIDLETGRTHQIRVHLANLGIPVFQDSVYGGKKYSEELPAHALHSSQISFEDPDGKVFRFEISEPLFL